jgi:hypothetical protein
VQAGLQFIKIIPIPEKESTPLLPSKKEALLSKEWA